MDEYHQRELKKSCRVCGGLEGKQKYSYSTEKYHVAEKLLTGFRIDVANDKTEIHPKNVCINCFVKTTKLAKNKTCQSTVEPVEWKAHEIDGCEVCAMFEKRNCGGKKPRERKGRGRPSNKTETSTLNISASQLKIQPSIIPQPIILNMPPIERFVSISEELLCPICKEVLDRPVQAGICDHFFCASCIEKWLQFSNTNNSTCPVCKTALTVTHLKTAPRLLLNLIATSCASCRICKTVLKLEQLQEHELFCKHYVLERRDQTIETILKTSTKDPLSSTEELLTTHLMKRKLSSCSSPNVILRTGGTVSTICIKSNFK